MYFHSGLVSSFLLAAITLARTVEHSPPTPRVFSGFKAGASLTDVHDTYSLVTTSLTIPWITGDVGSGINIYTAIDGENCGDISLRAGVKGQIQDTGSIVYTPYYEWNPRPIQTFQNVTVSGGDIITLFVSSMSPGSGTVMLANASKNQSSTLDVMSLLPLCRSSASWMIEPIYDATRDRFNPLANFLGVTFDASLAVGAGDFIFPGNTSTIYNMIEDGHQVTNVVANGADIIVENTYW